MSLKQVACRSPTLPHNPRLKPRQVPKLICDILGQDIRASLQCAEESGSRRGREEKVHLSSMPQETVSPGGEAIANLSVRCQKTSEAASR